MEPSDASPRNFLREIVAAHVADGSYGGRVVTRFPPEPNGYLHIGHAKSICLNFGLAKEFGGRCHLRMDDTNPTTEDAEYVESIRQDVRWLGFDWGEHLFHAADYFEKLYEYAEELIRRGLAYVCSLSEAELREHRGSVTEPGRASPWRERSVDENLDLFRRMRAGEFADGAHTLRAKIDMSAANMKLRDPPLYRIRRAHHYKRGDAWCIYPLYDYTHCLSDSLEGVTHSICTLEFENNRELYDWVLDHLPVPRPQPRQYEFARLNLTYTVLSKRKLLELVEGRHVSGWDDPRMPTISGLRRRGVTPEALREFCERIGVAKNNSVVDVALLENSLREDLNQRAPRVLAVLRPLRVVLTNLGAARELDAPYFPPDVAKPGSRTLPLGAVVYIERDDFAEAPPKGWHRLAPGGVVRLRHAAVIRCDDVVKDAHGELVELRCSLVEGEADTGVKGTIQWVDAERALEAEVRLYDRLFTEESPDRGDVDFKTLLNPASLVVLTGCKVEPSLATAAPGARYQFERHGFFAVDLDSKPGALVFNRTVPLRDSWARRVLRAETGQYAVTGAEAAITAQRTLHTEPGTFAVIPGNVAATMRLAPAAQALVDRHALAPADARQIADDAALTALLEGAVTAGAAAAPVSKLLVNDVARELGVVGGAPRFDGAALAELCALLDDGTLTSKLGRDVLAELARSGGSPRQIAEQRGYRQLTDGAAIDALVEAVLAAKIDLVSRYRAGESKLFSVLLGELMRASAGKANAKLAAEALKTALGA